VNLILVLTGAAGLGIALIFTLARFGHNFAGTMLLPAFCRLDDKSCGSIVFHPDASLLGVPNSILGLLFYGLALIVGFGIGPPIFATVLLYTGWCGVAMALYLAYSLIVKIKVKCVLCFTGHVLTLVITLLVTFR
jgi:uncharacterized membrane protein